MPTLADVQLREWVETLVRDRYKTVRSLAEAIGMTESGFSRAVKAGTFDVENCLKLANETGESAATVLQIAGKEQIHELIEKLYGKARKPKDAEAVTAYEKFAELKSVPGREGVLLIR